MMKASLCLKIMRPHQWLKNLMLFFPPFLGGMIFQKDLALVGIAPFFAFSFASSASYIFNDFMDLKSDLNHPHKSLRPLTSGALSKPVAVAMIIGLLTVAAVLEYHASA